MSLSSSNNFAPLSFNVLRDHLLKRIPLDPPSALSNFKQPFPSHSIHHQIWRWRQKSHFINYYYSAAKLRLARLGGFVIVSRKSALGDVVAATSVIPALRQSRPQARIIFFTSTAAAPLLWFDPDLDLVLTCRIERKSYKYLPLTYELSRNQFNIHEGMLRSVGIEGTGSRPRLVLSQEEKLWAQSWKTSLILGGRHLVGIHAGFTMQNKAWPQKRWFELVRWLQENGHVVVEFGAVAGYDSCLGLSAHGLPLRQVMALVSSCDVVICIDSFIMHTAVALDVPCIPLFGGTRADMYLPASASAWPVVASSECRFCHHWGESPRSYTPCIQETALCMHSIEVQDVINKLQCFSEAQYSMEQSNLSTSL